MELNRRTEQHAGVEMYVSEPCLGGERRARPCVVVLPEVWGLDDHMRDVADRFATAGYAVYVPSLYSAIDDERLTADRIAQVRKYHRVGGRAFLRDAETRAQVLAGLDSTEVAMIEESIDVMFRPPGDPAGHYDSYVITARECVGAVGTTAEGAPLFLAGFCIGGGVAAAVACGGASLDGVVVYYGALPTEADQVSNLNAPLLGFFGQDDRALHGRAGTFLASARSLGRAATIYSYPGSGHAFFNDTDSSFVAGASRMSWGRTLAFLADHSEEPYEVGSC